MDKIMLAFTNTIHTKESAVTLAKLHQEQDNYIRGTYGNETPTGWKGCSVGCMAKGSHGDYPALFGIDLRIAHLSDELFENITAFERWTVKIFESIEEGSNTTLAYYRFMHWLLLDEVHGVIKYNRHTVILEVGDLFLKSSLGEIITQKQWGDAANAANAAVNAAYTVRAAAYATYAAVLAAAYAAYAATNATYAARAAANAARAVANAARAVANKRLDCYNTMADKLCYFLAGGQ